MDIVQDLHKATTVRDHLPASAIDWHLAPAPVSAPADDLLTEAIIDGLAYRLIVVEAFDRLRTLTLQLDAAQQQQEQLRAEFAALRKTAAAKC